MFHEHETLENYFLVERKRKWGEGWKGDKEKRERKQEKKGEKREKRDA